MPIQNEYERDSSPVKAPFDTVHVHDNLSSLSARVVAKKPLWKRATLPEKKPGLQQRVQNCTGWILHIRFWHHNGENIRESSRADGDIGEDMKDECFFCWSFWSAQCVCLCIGRSSDVQRASSIQGEFVSFVCVVLVLANKLTSEKCKSNAEKGEKDTKVNWLADN